MLTTNEVIELVMEEPKLLSKTGKILNTWRLIMGQSTIPTFDIKYIEAITDYGEHVTLYDFEGLTGYDEDGTPYDVTELTKITEIDVDVYFDDSYLPNMKVVEDVVYYPPENRYVTLTYLMDIETEPLYINSLPLFDHTKVKYNFAGKIVIGIDNYHNILQPIHYLNCKLHPSQNGMVKVAYDVEVPYTMFYNKKVNEWLSNVLPSIPLVRHSLIVDLG